MKDFKSIDRYPLLKLIGAFHFLKKKGLFFALSLDPSVPFLRFELKFSTPVSNPGLQLPTTLTFQLQ